MRRFVALSTVLSFSLFGCSASQDAAIAAAVSKNAAAITTFCNTKVLPAVQSPLTEVALAAVGALPYGGDFALAVNSAGAACINIDAVAQSITTLPWLQSQLPVIQGAGKVAPPPVITPAPVTAAASPSV